MIDLIVDKIKHLDYFVLASIFLLACFSLLSLYPYSYLHPETNFFSKQLIFYMVGFFLVFVLSFFNFDRLKSFPLFFVIIYALSVVVLALLLLVGQETRGIQAWFSLFGLSFQVSEIVKIAILLVLAKYFSYRHIELYRPFHVVISGLYVAIPFGLIVLQPDLGSAAIFVLIWLCMLVFSGIKWRHLLVVFLIFSILAALGWTFFLKPFQKQRVISFLNPASAPEGASYSRQQSLVAVGSGGFLGEGFGGATQSLYDFLPEAYTDFAFATLAQSTGLVGVFLILSLFLVLIYRFISFALSQNRASNFSRLFSAGLGMLIFAQSAMHIGINLGLLPVTGLPLPFISYGGSFLLSLFVGVGIYQGIYSNNI